MLATHKLKSVQTTKYRKKLHIPEIKEHSNLKLITETSESGCVSATGSTGTFLETTSGYFSVKVSHIYFGLTVLNLLLDLGRQIYL